MNIDKALEIANPRNVVDAFIAGIHNHDPYAEVGFYADSPEEEEAIQTILEEYYKEDFGTSDADEVAKLLEEEIEDTMRYENVDEEYAEELLIEILMGHFEYYFSEIFENL